MLYCYIFKLLGNFKAVVISKKNKIEGTPIPKLAMVNQSKIYSKICHINLSNKTFRNLQKPPGTYRNLQGSQETSRNQTFLSMTTIYAYPVSVSRSCPEADGELKNTEPMELKRFPVLFRKFTKDLLFISVSFSKFIYLIYLGVGSSNIWIVCSFLWKFFEAVLNF